MQEMPIEEEKSPLPLEQNLLTGSSLQLPKMFDEEERLRLERRTISQKEEAKFIE